MQLYPAIDLKNGQCVRLTQGKFDQVKVYSEEPWEMARHWEEMGASYLHLVDLDGALAGSLVNGPVIEKIVKSIRIPVQIGGGIRSMETIEALRTLGVYRTIIGTKAVENPDFIKAAAERFGSEHIVVGVDAKDGLVATDGWERVSGRKALDLCLEMKEMGIRHIVYTDISRDGMLTGPNVEQTKLLTEKTGLDIIASGGVSGMGDLENLYHSGIHGAIIGKALYEERIDLKSAVHRFEQGDRQ